MVKVLIPWKMKFYKEINGYHPLIASFVEAAPKGIEFVIADDGVAAASLVGGLDRVTFELMANAYRLGLINNQNVDAGRYMAGLLNSRNPAAQARIESYLRDVDVVFHHTTPLHMSTLPFVVHYESLTTLFWPFINTGQSHHLVLRNQPIYHLVKAQLESPLCRGVFTHIQSSHDILVRCFNSKIIEEKAKYIPLGVESPPDMKEKIEHKINGLGQRKGLNILFTNSAHGNNSSFFLRGGLELLLAFERLLESHPDSTLTIVSNRPPDDTIEGVKLENVTWMEQGISEQELYDLLLEADIFALPSVGLHSYSVLRAMKFGAVLICSDAPGYEEYVSDGETAIIIPGRLEQVYQPDPETGWMRDDYSTAYGPEMKIATRLAYTLEWLANHPEQRRNMAVAAHDHVERRHALAPWVQSIADLMHA